MRVWILRGLVASFLFAAVAASWSLSALAAADVAGMVDNEDALEAARHNHSHKAISLTASATGQAPSFNNLNSHLSSPIGGSNGGGGATTANAHEGRHTRDAGFDPNDPEAANPTAGTHQPGYSTRYNLAGGYWLSDRMTIGPALGFSEAFYGRNGDKLMMEDPQLRLTIEEVANPWFGKSQVHTGLLISASVPVSDISRRRDCLGAVSIAGMPRVHFKGTPYSAAFSTSVRTGLYGRPEGQTDLITARVQAGIQGGYRISHTLECDLMFYGNGMFGPDLPMDETDLSNGPMHVRGQQMMGLMPSMKYQFNQDLFITPRLNWFTDQPLKMTTISISAMMRII